MVCCDLMKNPIGSCLIKGPPKNLKIAPYPGSLKTEALQAFSNHEMQNKRAYPTN